MSSWTSAPLGDLVTIVGGGTPTRSNASYYGGAIPWVTPKDMKSWEIRDAQVGITEIGLDNSSTRLVPVNSVLVVVRSGILKHTVPVGLNRLPVAINQDMKALLCDGQIDADFLARFVKFQSPIILQWVRATTAENFPIDKLKRLAVPLPPLPEQRRIADLLNRADALRAKRRAALAHLDTLVQSIFLDMFGDPVENPKRWPRVPLSSLLERIDSGWSPICLDRRVTGDEWGVLKLGSVTWCEYDSLQNKALPPGIEPLPELEVRAGDLLFARKNTHELVAACALVRDTPSRLLLSDLIFRLQLCAGTPVHKAYLHRLLICPRKRREVQKLAGGSAGSMPNISKARLAGVPIEVPPLKLQQEFARRVDRVDVLRAHARTALDRLDALFGSIQDRAFRGAL